MNPVGFKESNQTLKAPSDMPSCKDLPVFSNGEMCISCWRLSWKERLIALVWGRAWLLVWGKTHPPVSINCEFTPFEEQVK